MPLEKPISAEMLESICMVLGSQNTGSVIGNYLAQCGIEDVDPLNTKWKRLFNAFAHHQRKHNASNGIQVFIQKTLNPVRYADNHDLFEANRTEINTRLLFIGIELMDTGKFRRVTEARTIPEAQKRADTLKAKLKDRRVHADVLLFCKAELLQDNYFHAVFEATKSVAEKIREKADLTEDGAGLVDKAFGLGTARTPKLAINSLRTESEESEHKGFANLLKGMFGMFRNTTGHAPRIRWEIDEETALDCLTLASLLHKKLDNCIRTPY
ncbi:TIGR02391 family protein [Chitinophaga sp. 22321]|uniref:TIGR02391 family protein n=1 Tax=Chitinophaga sp. 22321 TaxID=3453909 RepID=UPI003F87F0C0